VKEIRAIPTTYNGVTYKSRLETRWAIFFDLLDIKHLYEPGKVFTGESNYIPDFLLPDLKAIFEVKPKEPTPKEIERLSGLTIDGVEYSECERLITSGTPGNRIYSVCNIDAFNRVEFSFVQCPFCGLVGVTVGPLDAIGADFFPLRHRCQPIFDIAKHYDIDPGFWSYGDDNEKPRVPTTSPALALAVEVSNTICLDGGNLHERIDREKKAQTILRQNGSFGDSKFLTDLHRWILALRRDPAFPYYLTFEWATNEASRSTEVSA
jgi:hypothetical protein